MIKIYFGGGAMKGVFGQGVAIRAQKPDIYDSIDKIFGSSSGALAAVSLVVRKTSAASTIYTERLTNGFIFSWKAPVSFFQWFMSTKIEGAKREKFFEAINLNKLFDIISEERNKKILLRGIERSKINIHVKVMNSRTGEIEYLNLKDQENPINILKASCCVAPYTNKYVDINGKTLIDATLVEPIGLKYFKDKFPREKIIFVISNPPKRDIKGKIQNSLEGLQLSYMYGDGYYKKLKEGRESYFSDLEEIRKNPDYLLITPPQNDLTRTRTTNRSKLLETLEAGKREAEKILNFVK